MAPNPTHTKQYTVQAEPKDFSNLKLDEGVPIPELGQHDVLVQWKYASLNYRDLIIARVGPCFVHSLCATFNETSCCWGLIGFVIPMLILVGNISLPQQAECRPGL